jgi:hypothetical protein
MWPRKAENKKAAILALAVWFVVLTAFVDSFHVHPVGGPGPAGDGIASFTDARESFADDGWMGHCCRSAQAGYAALTEAADPSLSTAASGTDYGYCPACWFIKNCNGYDIGWAIPSSVRFSGRGLSSSETSHYISISTPAAFPRGPPSH